MIVHNKFYNEKIKVTKNTRQENKRLVIKNYTNIIINRSYVIL